MNNMIIDEEWEDIKYYEGKYQVSNKGRIRSLSRMVFQSNGSSYLKKDKFIKLTINTNGYQRISLYKNGIQKNLSIHRLVAETFIENPNNLPEVNHKDEIKINNVVSNLEWCTRQYNNEYSKSKYWEILTPDGFLLEVFNLRKFCDENNLNRGSMYKVVNGIWRHHKGYKVWRKEG